MPKPLEKKHYTDDELIAMIRGSEHERKKALRFIYVNWWHNAFKILVAAGAQTADAEDAIQEAVTLLDNNVRRGLYKGESSLKNYFIGICKGRLFSNQRSIRRIDWTGDYLQIEYKYIEEQHPETIMLKMELQNIVHTILNRMNARCKEMLKCYGLGYKMKEIAAEMNLGNTNNAEQQVFQCRERLKKLLAKSPVLSNYLKTRHEQ